MSLLSTNRVGSRDVTTSSDEPKLAEVKGLLRRLETRTLVVDEGDGPGEHHRRSGRAGAPRVAHGPSSAAMLFLVANTAMATATVTSIGWYLFHASTMQKRADLSTVLAARRSDPVLPPAITKSAVLSPQAHAAGQVAAVRITVTEALRVAAGRSARAAVRLEPAEAVRSVDQLAFRGLPADIRLNRGGQLGDLWVVPPSALSDLEIAASPASRPGKVDITLAARASDGSELASTSTTLLIAAEPPSATAPTPVPAAAALDEGTQARHLAKARELLDIGQVGAARLLLQRAADAGSADAALMLGDTYDPLRLFQMQTQGIVGDIDKATFWYERADELGSADAKARIVGLGRWGP